MEVSKLNKFVTRINFSPISTNDTIKIALMSDLHIDSKYCAQKLLFKHLDRCKEEGRVILINGDVFDAMMGPGDRRGSIGSLKQEIKHNPAYFDNLVQYAVEKLLPYADNIAMIGMGNHESSVLKYYATNLIERLVTLLNYQKADKSFQISAMGTGGWVVIRTSKHTDNGTKMTSKIHFDHKISGGSVNGGTTSLFRANRRFPDADLIWFGHVHKETSRTLSSFGLDSRLRQVEKIQHAVITPCYKYQGAWETENGFDPYVRGFVEVDYKYNGYTGLSLSRTAVLDDSSLTFTN